jgi:protein ImuB
MRRVMALWLPSFSTDRVMRRLIARRNAPAEKTKPTAILLTRAVGGRELVERRCFLAAAAGVRAGIDLAQARSLVPGKLMLHVEPHRPERDNACLYRLGCWAIRISPTVALLPPDGLVCDLTGTSQLYGRERRVARSAARAINRLGFHVRTAVASTVGCAMAVAKFGPEPIAVVEGAREEDAFALLPAEALCGEPGLRESFKELGIERVKHLLTLPRRHLAARFGPSLLRRIDEALGRATETINPIHPPPPIEAEIVFDGPTDRFESVEAAARDTLEAFVRLLARRQHGVRELHFLILRPRGPAERIVLQLSRGSASIKHLWALLRPRLEHVDLGEPVDGLRVVAVKTTRLRDSQAVHAGLSDRAEDNVDVEAALGELTDSLLNRLGPEGVVRFSLRASYLPEQSYRAHPAMEHVGGAEGEAPARERPTLLLKQPEAVQVIALTPDGPVLEIGWQGKRERVVVCIGPERIGPEWWLWRGTMDAPSRGPRAGPPPERDYFAVQLASGPWLWVCRQAGTTRWYVHGMWG